MNARTSKTITTKEDVWPIEYCQNLYDISLTISVKTRSVKGIRRKEYLNNRKKRTQISNRVDEAEKALTSLNEEHVIFESNQRERVLTINKEIYTLKVL